MLGTMKTPELRNAIEMSEHHQKFDALLHNKRSSLGIGDSAKVCAVFRPVENVGGERFWVTITAAEGGRYQGKVDNVLSHSASHGLYFGDLISFDYRHIYDAVRKSERAEDRRQALEDASKPGFKNQTLKTAEENEPWISSDHHTMTIDGTCGLRAVSSLDALLTTLRTCRTGEFGEFWISPEKYPLLTIFIHGELAYLHFYLDDDGHPGFQPVGDVDSGDSVVFKEAGQADFSMPRAVVVSVEQAYQAAAEFFANPCLPGCIQWKEL